MSAIEQKVLEAWGKDPPYIHLTIRHAQQAAGFGPSQALHKVRQQVTLNAKNQLTARMGNSIYSGKEINVSKTGLENFTNQITDLETALSDTNAVVEYLKKMLGDTIDTAAHNGGIVSAGHSLGSQISQLIYHAGPHSNASKGAITAEIQDVFKKFYGTDVASLIRSLEEAAATGTITSLERSRLSSLYTLQDMINNERVKGISARNVLVEILTEQGLPDFLAKCAQETEGIIDDLVASAQWLGKEHISSVSNSNRSVQGKIDTMITFNIPVPGSNKTKKITQGISLKSNYKDFGASILSTSIKASLVYVGQYNYETLNALSLMDVPTLKRWILFSNLDRALQGTMQKLQGGIGNIQDRADILIEFTQNGIRIFSITEILSRFLKRLEQINDEKMLSKYGFGMANYKDNKVEGYSIIRNHYNNSRRNLLNQVEGRSRSTSQWLSATHSIQLDASVMMAMLNK